MRGVSTSQIMSSLARLSFLMGEDDSREQKQLNFLADLGIDSKRGKGGKGYENVTFYLPQHRISKSCGVLENVLAI